MKFKLLFKVLMKFSLIGFTLQCIFLSLLLANESEAQRYQSVKEVLISVDLKDASLIETFNYVENKTSFVFNYDNNQLKSNNTRISYKKSGATIEDLLLYVSSHANLRFRQVNNNINVLRKTKREAKRDSNKIEVRQFIEKKYGVSVKKINIVNTKSKKRRRGRIVGKTTPKKKAIVTLKKGQEIDAVKALF